MLRYYKNSVWCARDIIENKNKWTFLTYTFVIDLIAKRHEKIKRNYWYLRGRDLFGGGSLAQ